MGDELSEIFKNSLFIKELTKVEVFFLRETLECFERPLTSDVRVTPYRAMFYKMFESCGIFLLELPESSEEMKRLLNC